MKNNKPVAEVDAEVIEELGRLSGQQAELEERLDRMKERQDKVPEPVFKRVWSDYQDQLKGLAAQRQPLLQRARTEFAQLQSLIAGFDDECQLADLDRQEVEFRFELEEFDKNERDSRLKVISSRLGEREQQRSDSHALRERFLKAVRSPEELASAAPPVITATAEVPAAVEATMVIEPVTAPGGVRPRPGDLRQTPAATQALEALSDEAIRAATGHNTKPVTPVSLDAGSRGARPTAGEATVVVRSGRLMPKSPEAGTGPIPLVLKPLTLGADPDCDLPLDVTGVSGKHARIQPTREGFLLVDLGSRNGTVVNGAKITEHLLKNDDAVQIGAARFVFKDR